jgi:3-oxoacyl-[acyl-carrier protein] reductase
MDLHEKICLITGGTSGIGLATAMDMARSGATVVISGRKNRPQAISQLEKVAAPGKAIFLEADVADAAACRGLVERTVAATGGLDVLVHSAGGPVPGDLLSVTEEAWMQAFNIHVHAIFHLCRAAVPIMQSRGGGAITLVSSVAGIRGCAGILAYGVVKGALPQFTRALARELAETNVRVNCVSPGIIRTPFHDPMTPEQKENNLRNRIPLHREGKPEDVASAIMMMTTNEFMTGENIVVDGGMTMRIV